MKLEKIVRHLAAKLSNILKALAFTFLLQASLNAHAAHYKQLFSFNVTNGASPMGDLIVSSNFLYGTTYQGNLRDTDVPGADGTGTIFKIGTDGANFTTLYNFSAISNSLNSDGAHPISGLTISGNVLFGAASHGGTLNHGTVFSIGVNGTGFQNLHNFSGGSGDGAFPEGDLAVTNNMIFGTTAVGGTSGAGTSGSGTIFSVTADGSSYNVLYNFTAVSDDEGTNTDGANPFGGLVLDGNSLYGTTRRGGPAIGGYLGNGCGTIYKIGTNGGGFSVLHSFSSATYPEFTNIDGDYPQGVLTLSGNTLYGATLRGGTNGNGTIFKINTDGSGFTTLHNFYVTEGMSPVGRLALSSNVLYGTCMGGGVSGATLFRINTDGTCFTNLYNFPGLDSPVGGVAVSDGIVYGNTYSGDEVFALLPSPVTLDSDQTNFVFKSDVTYFVNAPISLYGTTTIERGAIVKFSPDNYASIYIDGTNLICSTTPENPAIFTVKDDDSVGEIISGSTGDPSACYGRGLGIMLYDDASYQISNLKFLFQGTAITLFHPDWNYEYSQLEAFNIQAFNCGVCFNCNMLYFKLFNSIFVNDAQAIYCANTFTDAEHLTVDHCDWVCLPNDGGGSSCYITNSLIAEVTNSIPSLDLDYQTNHTVTISGDSGVFKSSGNDGYYLAASSPYRDIGTTSIDSSLLSEINQMTTYSPDDGSLSDTNTPDLGYHYLKP